MDIPSLWNRVNLAKWAVPACLMPSVTAAMLASPSMTYDPHDLQFRGQVQRTTYFDTDDFALRTARRRNRIYCTLRVRCYEGSDGEAYVLSVKTDAQKWRREIDEDTAHAMTVNGDLSALESLLPPDLLARLYSLTNMAPLAPVVEVSYRRYAVEDQDSRLTLDVDVSTDAGKELPYGVLEYKSVDPDALIPASLAGLGIRPISLSKFLWATKP